MCLQYGPEMWEKSMHYSLVGIRNKHKKLATYKRTLPLINLR